jgi:molecular chaperone Hsp31 and glyoxalase 3
MAMPNGKKFSTGNPPVEMALPMLHFLSARFEIDLKTPTGAPVALEMWAMLDKDPHVAGFFHASETAFKNSKSLAEFLNNAMIQDAS